MDFNFIENSVIMIPITYKGYRLEGTERVRFRCLFKNAEGDFPYTLDMEEDNKGESGADGRYTITLDMSKYGILPGRYAFDVSLVLESGALVTIMAKTECHIDVIAAAKGLYKPNGKAFFGADFFVEQGTADGWTYRKFNSGRMEAWATRELLVTEINTISDTDLKSVTVETKIPNAMLTSGIEYVDITPRSWYIISSTAAISNNLLWGRFTTWNEQTTDLVIDTSTLWGQCYIIGRWK